MIRLSLAFLLLVLSLLTIPFSGINDFQISTVSKDPVDHDSETGGSKPYSNTDTSKPKIHN